jgi:signal transduction histidine kinase/CheY-like chemotaxis protein
MASCPVFRTGQERQYANTHMPDTQAEALTPEKSALEFLHRLLVRPPGDHPALDGLLAELAGAFAAPRAGLASLPDGVALCRHPAGAPRPARWPWEEEPSLLARASQGPSAVALDREGGGFLLTTLGHPGGPGWLLWLEDDTRSGWTDAESATLALAGHALGRWLSAEGHPRWADQLDRAARQARLEVAAQVTNRLTHDFGNVLTGVLGFSELALAQQVPANTPLHSYLTEVFRGASNGAAFTHQLRLFARRQSASSRPSHLAPVLAEEEQRLRAAHGSRLNLRVSAPADLPAVALDPEHLRPVLAALLDNACEALAGPGSVSVSARLTELGPAEALDLFGAARPGPHVEVTIADTGVGLSPEVQRRLFAEAFFSTKPRRGGFGLAIAYGILHAHRGGFRLHPGSERGVVARVLIPLAPTPPPETERREASAPARPEKGRGEKVLVVDPDPATLGPVVTALEQAGYRVQGVSTPQEALHACAAQSADPVRLVLCDPGAAAPAGIDLARRLLKRDPRVRVLLAGPAPAPEITRPLAGRAVEWVAKPIRSDVLQQAVRSALDRPHPPGKATGAGEGPVVSAAK